MPYYFKSSLQNAWYYSFFPSTFPKEPLPIKLNFLLQKKKVLSNILADLTDVSSIVETTEIFNLTKLFVKLT